MVSKMFGIEFVTIWTLSYAIPLLRRIYVSSTQRIEFEQIGGIKTYNMIKVYLGLMLGLLMVSPGYSYCPLDKMHSTGECGLRMTCIGDLRGARLPEKCMGSINYPVTVDLTLKEAVKRFDDNIDAEFLISVTSFRASSVWPEVSLSILSYMPRLQNLYLVGNKMEKIYTNPFYLLNQLEILDLARNRLSDITDLFNFESYPNKLKKLNLSFNLIVDVSDDALQELTSLVELDLSHNMILKLEKPFHNLTSLEVLKLNNNKIRDLNGALDNLLKLKHLYLKSNEILQISDDSLKRMDHLETFDISYNHLESMTPDIFVRHWDHFGSHSVCKVTLSGNQLTSVPNATSDDYLARFTRSFKNTVDISTELDLSENSLTNIEYNAFRSLLRMTKLDLSRNKLIDFYVNADDLTYVKFLNLSTNFITQLYFESFKSMSNLQNLDLSSNNLDYIPGDTFINNYKLKLVNMSYNDLHVLQNVHIKIFHPDGGVLDLSHNELSGLAIPLGEALRMKILNLQANKISDPMHIDLRHQTELINLDMSKNQIQHLNSSSLNLPVTLSYLDISDNEINQIGPATFHRVGHLKTLRLSRNKLSRLGYGTFQGLPSLLNLDLSYNNIAFLDSKLFVELKSLSVIYITYNSMKSLDYRGWLNHKTDLNVFVDGNNFTCDWLGTALYDFHNDYSKMRLCVLSMATTEHSMEGIPCMENELSELRDPGGVMMNNDERLLAVSLKILEAVKDQTYYLKKYMWRSL